MSNPLHDETLRQAVDAARTGDRARARELVDEVLNEDEENHRAWLLLARLTDNIDEKRMALANVLQLDPGNKKASELLEKLDERATRTRDDEEIIPGVPRRLFVRIVGGVGLLVSLLIIVIIAAIIVNNNRRAQESADATAAIQQQTDIAEQAQAAALAMTETRIALVSPTPSTTPTRSGPTLPPTPTQPPTLEPTATLEPIADIPGRIIGWSGRDLRNIGYLPVVMYNVSGASPPEVITDRVGRYATVSSDAQRILYTRYVDLTSDFQIELIDMSGEVIVPLLGLMIAVEVFDNSQMPQFSANGTTFVFTGLALDTLTNEIYIGDLSAIEGEGVLVRRVTNDTANYSFPSLSPNGNSIAVIRDNPESDNPGPDLVVVDANTGAPRSLTSDRAAVYQTHPRWSPDGTLIAYAAAPADARNRNNIYIIPADGSRDGLALIESDGNDIHPVFSPDQRFLAFASNRGNSGNYDLYIHNLSAQQTFRRTDSIEDDFPGGWID